MDSPVTEKMCQERHKSLSEKVDKLTEEIIKIRILWNGNGKVGAGYKVENMWEAHQKNQKTTQGWIDWAFRLAIVTMLGLIINKVGL